MKICDHSFNKVIDGGALSITILDSIRQLNWHSNKKFDCQQIPNKKIHIIAYPLRAVGNETVIEKKLKCLEGQPADAVEQNDDEHHANDLRSKTENNNKQKTHKNGHH